MWRDESAENRGKVTRGDRCCLPARLVRLRPSNRVRCTGIVMVARTPPQAPRAGKFLHESGEELLVSWSRLSFPAGVSCVTRASFLCHACIILASRVRHSCVTRASLLRQTRITLAPKGSIRTGMVNLGDNSRKEYCPLCSSFMDELRPRAKKRRFQGSVQRRDLRFMAYGFVRGKRPMRLAWVSEG